MWAGLLLPRLASAAVGFSLPAERRPALCQWTAIDTFARLLASDMLRPVWEGLSEAAGRNSRSPEAERLARLLTSAVALLQLRQADTQSKYCVDLFGLLGTSLWSQFKANWAAADVQRLTRHSKQLLGLLPGLALALQQQVASGSAADVEISAVAARAALLFLGDATQRPGGVGVLGGIEACASAASTALRMLPAAASAAQQLASERPAGHERALRAVTQLADTVLDVATSMGRACADAAGRPTAQQQLAASAAPSFKALWQLHSTACRLVAAHSSLSQQLACTGQLELLAALIAEPAFAVASLEQLERSIAAEGGGPMLQHAR